MKTTNPITLYRETNSISQPQLAVRADLSISTLSGLESGRLDPLHVRPKTWRKLAKAMKEDVVELRTALISWYGGREPADEELGVSMGSASITNTDLDQLFALCKRLAQPSSTTICVVQTVERSSDNGPDRRAEREGHNPDERTSGGLLW